MDRTACARIKRRLSVGVTSLVCLLLAMSSSSAVEEKKAAFQEIERAVKGRWLGKPESSVIERLGAPKDRSSQGSATYLTWQSTVKFGASPTASIECQAIFHFEAGKLTDLKLDGTDAGLCRRMLQPLLTDPDQRK